MRRIMMDVEGMHCRSCEMLLEESLADIEGIKEAKASSQEGKVSITFDEGKADLRMICGAIEDEGYKIKES